jgi:nucleoside 2-deoxyribosyltransferase
MEFTLFISHYSADVAVTDRVRRFSEAIGFQVYVYEENPRAGEPLASKLVDAIRSAQGVVAVLTKAGAARSSVQQELGAAVALGKPVFALVEDGVDVASMALLQGLEFIRLKVDRTEEAIEALQQSITAYRQKEIAKVVGLIVLLLLIAGAAWALSRDS